MYRARDTRLARDVAIKVLPGELARDPQRRQRLEREAQAISALNHPNVCALFDVGRAELPGGADRLPGDGARRGRDAREPPRARAAAARAGGLARGPDRRGARAPPTRRSIVHRDLKPGNVMLTRSGAKLLDFGLARTGDSGCARRVAAERAHRVAADAAHRRKARVVGTWPYLSPEQLGGRPADARSDVFALGAVLYEMLTARRAFPGATLAEVHAAILGDERARPARAREGAARAARGRRAQVPGEGPAGALAERRRRGARAASRRRRARRRRGRAPDRRSASGSRSRWRSGSWPRRRPRACCSAAARPSAGPLRFVGAAAARRAAAALDDGHADRGLARRAPGRLRGEHRRRAAGACGCGRPRTASRAGSREPTAAWAPFFSPDGREIAFFAERRAAADSGGAAAPRRASRAPSSGHSGTWGNGRDDPLHALARARGGAVGGARRRGRAAPAARGGQPGRPARASPRFSPTASTTSS